MRSDMATVVTERPRSGGRLKTPKGSKREYQREVRNEAESHREKIRQKWGWEHKQFTDVLGPIYGYLLSQVGRPWNDVFSEICQHLPANSLNTSHVRDHIKQFVEINVIMIDDYPHDTEGHSITNRGRYPFAYYVHPETGILCKLKQKQWITRKGYKKPKAGINVPGEPLKQYHCIDSIWYILTLKPAPKYSSHRTQEYDIGYKCRLDYNERVKIYGGDLVSMDKRQLNGKEVKKAGLHKRKAA
jgi:hypothetical protein